MIKKLAFLLGVMAAVAFTSSPAMAQRHHGDHGRGHGHSGVSINLGVHGPVYGYGGYRYRDPYYGYYSGRRYYRDRSYYHDDYRRDGRHHRRERRAEERRGGAEWVRTCRTRWWPDN